jgi:hypothetical protein
MPPVVDFAEMSEIMVFPEKNYDEDTSTIRLNGITFPKYTVNVNSNEILTNNSIQEFLIHEYNNVYNSQFNKSKNPLYTTSGTKIESLSTSSFSSLRSDSITGLVEKLCNMSSAMYYKGNGSTKIIFPGIGYTLSHVPLYIRGKKPLVELPTGIMIDGAGENTVL